MTIEAYAKINFTLEVFGKRSDGYHELRSLVMPVTLSDTLTVEAGEGYESDSGYADDLCLKAARALGRWARISVEKRIPAGGGLGGGSADAAAVLRALDEVYGLKSSTEELAAVGAKVGSDVPALVMGGAVIMRGRGETVERVELPALDIVLVDPSVASSTAEVYAAYGEGRADGEDRTRQAIDAIRGGDFEAICGAAMNDLQAAATRLHPEIGAAIAALEKAGAKGAVMTGSGACVFAVAKDATAAKGISETLKQQGYRAWALKTR